MSVTSVEQIEKAIKYVWEWPISTGFNSKEEANEIIKRGLEEEIIPQQLLPKAIATVIQLSMELNSVDSDKAKAEVFNIVNKDLISEAIVQTLIATSERFEGLGYWGTISLLGKLLATNELDLRLLATIKDEIQKANSHKPEIIVRSVEQALKESPKIHSRLLRFVFSLFEVAPYWACQEMLDAIIDETKKGRIVNLEIETIPFLWEKVQNAIRDPEYSLQNFPFIRSSAKLIAILSIRNQEPINQLPEPVNSLLTGNFTANGIFRIRYLILINNEIENYYYQVCREKYGDERALFFVSNPEHMRKTTEYYFGNLYVEWHAYWAAEKHKDEQRDQP